MAEYMVKARWGRIGRWEQVVLVLLLLGGSETGIRAEEFQVTLVDRFGNKHEISRFTYQDRAELSYYVGDVNRIRSFAQLDRVVFEGEEGDEEQVIKVHRRGGGSETGSILTGGNSGLRAHDAFGGGYAEIKFNGVTELGPFYIRLNDVREVIFRHPEGSEAPREHLLKATIINTKGESFEVEHLRYFGNTRFKLKQRRLQRPIDMYKVAKIDFIETESREEQRPVTVELWSGKTLQGTVNVSTVRLPGETDKAYYTRQETVFTGRFNGGMFAIGMDVLRQIRFHQEKEEEKVEEEQIENSGGDTTATQQ
ncbi:MAG: hypothetical protein GKR89_21255 [Candidatus Latescibacteria bacterium]|nr:hypothetical protein [Candidatus Latescibacterota bacterium]